MSQPIVTLVRTTVRCGPRIVLRDLSLSIGAAERWVVTGVLGSGKSTLLDVIRGDLPAEDPRSVRHPFLRQEAWPGQVIKLLNSGTAGGAAAGAYFSERYHSRREDDVTLRNWLERAVDDSEAAVDVRTRCESIAEALDLGHLLDASLMNLSNGQTRRSQVARALLQRPEVLLLDEPFVGLDVASRAKLLVVLGRLGQGVDATKFVLALRPLDEMPDWATHLLVLGGEDGRAVAQGTISEVMPAVEALRKGSASATRRVISPDISANAQNTTATPLVEMNGVNIAYWSKSVLQDVSWKLHRGARWHVQGPNGSGKTTLLALVLGDHPKLFANDVKFDGLTPGGDMPFADAGRAAGNDAAAKVKVARRWSVNDWQAMIGHTSPEIHRHFPQFLTVRQALYSAWSESFHPPARADTTPQMTTAVENIVGEFRACLSHGTDSAGDDVAQSWLDKRYGDLTMGEQRLVLLLRAIVKRPALVVLDEPFAGMDLATIELARKYIDVKLEVDPKLVSPELEGPQRAAVLFVTHYDDEVPDSVDQVLRLDDGRVVLQG